MSKNSSAASTAKRDAGRLRHSSWFRAGARTGFAVSGLLHILIGALAVSIAVGGGGGEADQTGALSAIASTPAGALLLWVMVAGLFALAIWQVLEAVTVRESDGSERVRAQLKEAGKGAAYLVLAITALRYATGGGGSGEKSTEKATAGLLGSPLGAAVLLAVAAIVVAVGIGFVVSGFQKRFLTTITPPRGAAARGVTVLGQVGFIAKGIAVTVVGILLAAAVFTADPQRAGGLDGALKALAALPFGVGILIAIGLGFLAYGVFFFVRAWRARL